MLGVTGDSTTPRLDWMEGLVGGEAFGGLKVGGVKILRTVGQEVETGHQQDGVDGRILVILEDFLDPVKEDLGLGQSGLFDVNLLLDLGAEDLKEEHGGHQRKRKYRHLSRRGNAGWSLARGTS